MLTNIIDDIRDLIGREVTFYVVASSIACPVCGLDPVTGLSTDSFCLTCSGVYWIPVISGHTTTAHVTWQPADIMDWQSGGKYYDGDCRVQVKYTVANLDAVDNASYVVVDNKRLRVISKILRGVPSINRILVDLKEEERTNE